MDKDLPPGEGLVAGFRPFLEELVASDLSPKTIQKHVDNVGELGGEFIRGTSKMILLCERSQDAVLAE